MTWLTTHRTKILGVAAALVGAVSVMTTSMTFDGLLEPTTIRWVAIVCNLASVSLGVFTAGVGFSNSNTVRVEEARATVATEMTRALNTEPPKP